MNNNELFLQYFNQIQATMAQQLKLDDSTSFKTLIDFGRSRDDKLITRYFDELDLYRQLRNILVHENVPLNNEIATASTETVNRMKQIAHNLTHPATVDSLFNTPVTTYQLTDSLSNLLQQVGKKNYTQFPIFDQQKLVGIITENSLTNFLADCLQHGTVDLQNFTVGDILSMEPDQNNYEIIGINKPVFDVREELQQKISEGNSAFVLLVAKITHDPTPKDLVGVITPFDLPIMGTE